NLAQGYDVSAQKYKSTWTEMGIGCEACHGAGRPHVTLAESWEKNHSSKPAYDNSANNHRLSALLKTVPYKSYEPSKILDTRAYRHAHQKNPSTGISAGARYQAFATPFLLSEPIPANDFQGESWPDGRPNRLNRPHALTPSGCFRAGATACTRW